MPNRMLPERERRRFSGLPCRSKKSRCRPSATRPTTDFASFTPNCGVGVASRYPAAKLRAYSSSSTVSRASGILK
jgi:hypothetical protein